MAAIHCGRWFLDGFIRGLNGLRWTFLGPIVARFGLPGPMAAGGVGDLCRIEETGTSWAVNDAKDGRIGDAGNEIAGIANSEQGRQSVHEGIGGGGAGGVFGFGFGPGCFVSRPPTFTTTEDGGIAFDIFGFLRTHCDCSMGALKERLYR